MSPNYRFQQEGLPKGPGRQQGFLMPVAAFIIVVMGIFALTLSRNTAQTSIATAQEIIALQAFYAAESGAQSAMSQLFYDTANSLVRTGVGGVDSRCAAFAQIIFAVPGLSNCSVNASCSFTTDAGNTTSFYQISSNATCGAGDVTANRVVQVSSFIRDNI